MIGSDLCALLHTKSKKRQNQYLCKITTAEERKRLASLRDEWQIPLAWSIKEASYKYYRRRAVIKLCPKKFRIESMQWLDGESCKVDEVLVGQGFSRYAHIETTVKTCYGKVVCKTIITNNFLHTILAESIQKLEQTYWGFARIDSDSYSSQSSAVRQYAIRHYSNIYDDQATFQFRKSNHHVPILFINDVRSENDFSFSHDQHYIGYAWCVPDTPSL